MEAVSKDGRQAGGVAAAAEKSGKNPKGDHTYRVTHLRRKVNKNNNNNKSCAVLGPQPPSSAPSPGSTWSNDRGHAAAERAAAALELVCEREAAEFSRL